MLWLIPYDTLLLLFFVYSSSKSTFDVYQLLFPSSPVTAISQLNCVVSTFILLDIVASSYLQSALLPAKSVTVAFQKTPVVSVWTNSLEELDVLVIVIKLSVPLWLPVRLLIPPIAYVKLFASLICNLNFTLLVYQSLSPLVPVVIILHSGLIVSKVIYLEYAIFWLLYISINFTCILYFLSL